MAGTPVRVLVVDDQAPFRDAARAVLARGDVFELVGEAESGEDALEVVDTLKPDLVLMDINMGGIDGIEATRRLTAARPETTVVLVSTYAAADLPLDVHECGASAYLHKEELTGRALRKLWEAGGQPGWRVRSA